MQTLKLNRRFSVAPMMECSVCRRICLFFNFLGRSPSVCIVLFVVPLYPQKLPRLLPTGVSVKSQTRTSFSKAPGSSQS